jgi:hypothetical protein
VESRCAASRWGAVTCCAEGGRFTRMYMISLFISFFFLYMFIQFFVRKITLEYTITAKKKINNILQGIICSVVH